jgi:predicted dehydrogenase
MAEVRIGLVGMNVIGQPLAKGFLTNPRSRIVALCDVVEERMRAFGAELPYPTKHYTDYTALCRDPEVDAVLISTPNQWHVPIGLEAVRNDKHVLIIKPLADSVEAAQQIVTTAESSGVVNMMALSMRFNAEIQHLGGVTTQGTLGEIYYARARSIRRSGIPVRRPGFIQKGGGAYRDMGVHLLDATWWMLGMPRPVSVTGIAGAKFGPRGLGFMTYEPQPPDVASQFAVDDYGAGLIRFENGAGLQLESFWASHQPNEVQIEMFGTEAGARLNPMTLYQTVNGAPMTSTIELPRTYDVWERIASHFVDCILDGTRCEAPLRHGLIVQEILEAVLESAVTGREVAIRST